MARPDSAKIRLFVGILLFVLVVCPFPLVVARKCTVEVVDANGKPCPTIKVIRGWAYGSPSTLDERFTGADGTLKFEAHTQWRSLLGRFVANIEDVLAVHGNAHIEDGYVVSIPKDYTAKIESEAPFKWVYDPGHLAKVDFGGLTRNQPCHAKFILKKTNVK